MNEFANICMTTGPILLGVSECDDLTTTADNDDNGSWKELPRHQDEDQVQLDVNRAFIYYPHGKPR